MRILKEIFVNILHGKPSPTKKGKRVIQTKQKGPVCEHNVFNYMRYRKGERDEVGNQLIALEQELANVKKIAIAHYDMEFFVNTIEWCRNNDKKIIHRLFLWKSLKVMWN